MKNSIACAAAAAFTLVMAASLWFAGCGGSSDKNPSGDQDSENGTDNGTAGSSVGIEISSAEGPIEVEIGQKVGDFTAPDLKGNRIRLSDYEGKVVMLDFWASWCPPCEGEVPYMKKVYDKYRSKGFEIIGVSLDHDENDLNEFLDRMDIDWPQIFTGKSWRTSLVVHYSIKKLPEPWLIGKDGKLITKEARGEYLEALVKKALKVELE